MEQEQVRLTQYSHGAGCGCKIAPGVLDQILAQLGKQADDPHLIVGHGARDDAAVYDLGDGTAVVSTTDFFMPIVDDPHTFGRIAAANAISDIYAMGGTPLMAIAILGWPVDKLAPEVAGRVLEGGRSICAEAGIPLAGGHSIDSPEPIFGLAVSGRVTLSKLKKNGGAAVGDLLYLTKPLGVGMVTTAQKKGMVEPAHLAAAEKNMTRLNKLGAPLGEIKGVNAMTDVTGFGLGGHALEMARATGVDLVFEGKSLPLLDREGLVKYHAAGCVPGGTRRNFASYGGHLDWEGVDAFVRDVVCDPQTSGGLLVSVDPSAKEEVEKVLRAADCHSQPIGEVVQGQGRVKLKA
ncbi:selenide, water dikinase SelD [Flavobacteriales bacterium]|nr:selenide, water dikinase SelD [Flavobacteriales bacterium]